MINSVSFNSYEKRTSDKSTETLGRAVVTTMDSGKERIGNESLMDVESQFIVIKMLWRSYW